MTFTDLLRTDNFTPGTKTKVFLSGKFAVGDVAPVVDVALAAGVTEGDTTLTVATGGFGAILYEGTRIQIGSDLANSVYVRTKTTSTTQTTIQIEPAKFALAIATPAQTCTIPAWIPFLGAKTVSLDVSGNEVSDEVFSDDAYMEKFISSLNASGSASGPWVYGDPGLDVLIEAMEDLDRCYMEILYNNQRGGRFAVVHPSIAESIDKAGFVQRNPTFVVTGKAGFLPGQQANPFN